MINKAVLALIFFLPLDLYANSATLLIKAKVIKNAITAIPIQKLDFGIIKTNNNYTVINVSPFGNRSGNNNNIDYSSSSYAGITKIKGDPNTNYKINIPSSVIFNNVENTGSLVVDKFMVWSKNLNKTITKNGILDDKGFDILNIGGSLNIAPNSKAGNYKGFVNISISYN